MAAAFAVLARRPWVSVGLAVLVETAILLPLALADSGSVVGIPAAVAAAIAGTVAVVAGPFHGAVVALAGALVFGAAEGWGAGAVSAVVVWPAIVAAAGVFGRRVQAQRRALAQLMTAQEAERQRLALELHDETAQQLTAALLMLGRAERAATGADAEAAGAARELIQEAITNIRELAVDLRPKVLDDFGLAPALERLTASVGRRAGLEVTLDVEIGNERLPREVELTVYRAVQEVLADVESTGTDGTVALVLRRAPGAVHVEVSHRPCEQNGPARRLPELAGVRERIRLAGGRVGAEANGAGMRVTVDLPLQPAAGRAGAVS